MTITMQRFEGFADRDGKFFKALARNQDREWFQAHKKEYEEGWSRPMAALLEELRAKIAGAFPGRTLGEPKVFRIFRDVRFAKDKSPYKTHVAGVVPMECPAGADGEAPAPVYLQLGTETFAGSGCYMLSPKQLEGYRAAVLDEQRGRALVAAMAKLEKAGFTVSSHGDGLKKVPRGMDPDHPRAELLKRKSLTISFPPIPKELIVSRELLSWLARETKKSAPLTEWLAEATT